MSSITASRRSLPRELPKFLIFSCLLLYSVSFSPSFLSIFSTFTSLLKRSLVLFTISCALFCTTSAVSPTNFPTLFAVSLIPFPMSSNIFPPDCVVVGRIPKKSRKNRSTSPPSVVAFL